VTTATAMAMAVVMGMVMSRRVMVAHGHGAHRHSATVMTRSGRSRLRRSCGMAKGQRLGVFLGFCNGTVAMADRNRFTTTVAMTVVVMMVMGLVMTTISPVSSVPTIEYPPDHVRD